MKICNSDFIDAWLFEHAVLLGNICDSIKGEVNGELVNIAWIDRNTNERVEIQYDLK